MSFDEFPSQLTMETLKEFDWCLNQLECLQASMTISDMASNKVLSRSLLDMFYIELYFVPLL